MTEDRFNQLIAERKALMAALDKIDAEFEAAHRLFEMMERLQQDEWEAGR